MDDYEDLKIAHERAKRDELKALEAQKATDLRKIQDEAEREVELAKTRLQKQLKSTS